MDPKIQKFPLFEISCGHNLEQYNPQQTVGPWGTVETHAS